MKKIIAEFPIELEGDAKSHSLYRFQSMGKPFAPTEIKIKPTSGYTEIKINFPVRNSSVLKIKQLGATSMVYKALPTPVSNMYNARIENNRILLSKINSVALFAPLFQYFPVASSGPRLKKAESREEFEHRKRSINYKLKCIDEEPFQVREYVENKEHKNNLVIPSENTEQCTEAIQKELMQMSIREKTDFLKLEQTIKNARIVNSDVLIGLFKNKDAVYSSLYKMTEAIGGRYILKSKFYERALWERREKLLSLFKRNGTTEIKNTLFLGIEQWMADEIAAKEGQLYVLKGHKETINLDKDTIEQRNKNMVWHMLCDEKMLNVQEISDALQMDSEIIHGILNDTGEFHHLMNNSYALNNEAYWFNSVLLAFTNKKSMSLDEISAVLSEVNEYSEHAITEELGHYCVHRGGRFYLKVKK
ncbi:hypothetical protein ENBRE01_1726 [Enteropsectra breve]|nr:hypothetical protein ENBRE01_1022 [Enteropsectra breve]KAI5150810.1 hypothetical protein ENBRE01_1726 [Enteropsectra breve]